MFEDIIAKNLLMERTCFHCKHHNTKYDNWNSPQFGHIECARSSPPKSVNANSSCIDYHPLNELSENIARAANLIWKNAHRA
jgi:hypothetical protein